MFQFKNNEFGPNFLRNQASISSNNKLVFFNIETSKQTNIIISFCSFAESQTKYSNYLQNMPSISEPKENRVNSRPETTVDHLAYKTPLNQNIQSRFSFNFGQKTESSTDSIVTKKTDLLPKK